MADTIFSYGVYIVPWLILALYGVSKGGFAAVGVAYFVLLLMCTMYLAYQRGEAPTFR